MRRWDLIPSNFHLPLAADIRLSMVDYEDDQIWSLNIGEGDRAGISLQTQYGKRVGLCSLVPLWQIGDRILYEYNAYHTPPRLVSFSSNFQQVEATLIEGVALQLYAWAMDSHNIGLQFQLVNETDHAIDLRFDIFGHVARNGVELPLGIITLSDEGHALYLGDLGDIHPVVRMVNGVALDSNSPKIGQSLTIPAQGKGTIRLVHSGEHSVNESIRIGQAWLKRNWGNDFGYIATIDRTIPQFRTGKPYYDLALLASGVRLVQALMPDQQAKDNATMLVGTRQTGDGFRQHTRQYHDNRTWQGYDVYLLWQHAPTLARINPAYARNLLQWFIGLQADDGSIYLPTHPSSPSTPMLCPPLLAQIAFRLLPNHNDDIWADLFEPLYRFLMYWMTKDADADGAPEWQEERQMGYVAFPTFGNRHGWAQGLAVETVESPDLLVYLHEEVQILQKVANATQHKKELTTLADIGKTLNDAIQATWTGTHFSYRDRDSHAMTTGNVLLTDGRGDETHTLTHPFDEPTRVMIAITGGVRHTPNFTLQLSGQDAQGRDVVIKATASDFAWHYRRGVYTTPIMLQRIDSLTCNGLSRVYTLDVNIPDYTRVDINGVIPLVLANLPNKQKQALVRLLKDEEHFLRPNGLTLVSQQDKDFDASSREGGGGIWLYWMVRLCEALLIHGEATLAVDVVKCLLELQMSLMRDDAIDAEQPKVFGQFYDSDQAIAYGEVNHLAGFIPLDLMMQFVGIDIEDNGHYVVIKPEFPWNRSITVEQHGVSVRRTRKRVTVKFASGEKVTYDAPEKETTVKASAPATKKKDKLPAPPPKRNIPSTSNPRSGAIKIDVEVDE